MNSIHFTSERFPHNLFESKSCLISSTSNIILDLSRLRNEVFTDDLQSSSSWIRRFSSYRISNFCWSFKKYAEPIQLHRILWYNLRLSKSLMFYKSTVNQLRMNKLPFIYNLIYFWTSMFCWSLMKLPWINWYFSVFHQWFIKEVQLLFVEQAKQRRLNSSNFNQNWNYHCGAMTCDQLLLICNLPQTRWIGFNGHRR